MTLPIEEKRAVNKAKAFLLRLLNPKLTPKVPRKIREEARAILKHMPGIIKEEDDSYEQDYQQ